MTFKERGRLEHDERIYGHYQAAEWPYRNIVQPDGQPL
jgi:hypothetical protein